MKTGRNDPCPCGSGKKYKHCCISVSREVSDEIKEALAGQDFESIEEQQAAADTLFAKQNQKPRDDFLGLSSDQVHRMLNFAYDTPELFQFPEQLTIEPDAPILMLMEGIVSAIDDKGLQATKARGSLPQKLCRDVWSDYSKLYADDIFASFHKVNKEDDFLRAFPMLIDGMEGTSYSTPEEDLRNCYYYRACKRFLVFLGLAKLEVIKTDKLYKNRYKIEKTPLFDAVLQFNLIDPKAYKATHSNVHSDHLH